MIVRKWIRNAYFKMERALLQCGISKQEIESYVDTACDSFENISYLPDFDVETGEKRESLYGEFKTRNHTADAIRHMYRVASILAAKHGVMCGGMSWGWFSVFVCL